MRSTNPQPQTQSVLSHAWRPPHTTAQLIVTSVTIRNAPFPSYKSRLIFRPAPQLFVATLAAQRTWRHLYEDGASTVAHMGVLVIPMWPSLSPHPTSLCARLHTGPLRRGTNHHSDPSQWIVAHGPHLYSGGVWRTTPRRSFPWPCLHFVP
jgi:hypothetical protein